MLDRVVYNSKIVYVPKRFYNYCFDNPSNSSNSPQNKYKNTVDRAISFAGRYEWMKDKADIEEDTKQQVLYKAVPFCIGSFCRYKNNTYNSEDIDYIYRFLKTNKKEIMKLKQLDVTRKLAVRLLIVCPKIFSSMGAAITKKR